jgi:phosphate starvation-inducible PhoH-like protein
MKMLLTRLGRGSKCVITGDVTQIDLPRGVLSGLVDALTVLRNVKGISVINFNEEDVIRHPLVARIVSAYQKRKEVQEG